MQHLGDTAFLWLAPVVKLGLPISAFGSEFSSQSTAFDVS
ncbi:DUF1010 domain-containing protein [Comamonas denitrificans]